MMRVEHDWAVTCVAKAWTFVLLCAVDLTEEEELLSRTMMKYWANFARNG
jgi:hypothetical protein